MLTPRLRAFGAVAILAMCALLLGACSWPNRLARGPASQPDTRSSERFATLPPGSTLPSGEECATRVRRTGWEPRPENKTANRTTAQPGLDYQLVAWMPVTFGMDPRADQFRARIDGNFTGTTDEIIQWGACKWGLDEDIVRAVAVQESFWKQSQKGDPDSGGYQSYGLLQIKRTAHAGTYPASVTSTAWNVDYALAYRRACFEGYLDWLHQIAPEYHEGDEWGCVGHWFSGRWKDPGALDYIRSVQRILAQQLWRAKGF